MLHKYINAFEKLRRDYRFGGAPHKPILLLSVLEGVRRKEIIDFKVYITPELIFCFREYWAMLVNTPHKINFSLPFFHLRSEPFWKLVTKPGLEIAITKSNSVKSLTALNAALKCATIDPNLFELMLDPVTNEILKQVIIERYFPGSGNVMPSYSGLEVMQTELFMDDSVQYRNKINAIQSTLPEEQVEEELFVRGALFKREIPKLYNYSCAATKTKVVTNTDVQMVDACHIIPFSISKDDTVRNGISFSPTIHRAFDRGIITLNDDFKIKVSSRIKTDDSPYSIKRLEGVEIDLPVNVDYHPLLSNLQWHRKEVWLS